MSIGSITSGLFASLGGGLTLMRAAADGSGPVSQIRPVTRRDPQSVSNVCPNCGGGDCACAASGSSETSASATDSSSAGASEATYTPASLLTAVQKRSGDAKASDGKSAAGRPANGKSSSGKELSDEQSEQVEKLKQRDTQVRQHEAAHQSAAGGLASGGATFEYETGPDGRRYAVGGEVNIDTSDVSGDPRATIAKLQQVRAAALAPADPSGQDRNVAAQASARIAKAQAELSSSATEGAGAAANRGDTSAENGVNKSGSPAKVAAQTDARADRTQRVYQQPQTAGDRVNQFA